ncbi:hypothetical protein DH2020_015295 [Rehmannia glutinosa]|uniref:Protein DETOXIFICATION n=1 Tax=Rehmannia glutinosa TaxID=99300 RepID=A0ABR0WTV7_REHGL
MSNIGIEKEEIIRTSLIEHSSTDSGQTKLIKLEDDHQQQINLAQNIWIESKKLWQIVGPAAFTRVASYSLFIITQAFVGHIGDLELAAMSIAINVVLGFDFGLMLGMASALETLCGQAYGAKKYYMLGVYLQHSWLVLTSFCVFTLPIFIFASPILKLLGQPADLAELSGLLVLCFIPIHFSFAFQFPQQRFLQSQLKNSIIAWLNFIAVVVHVLLTWLVVYRLPLGVVGAALILTFSWWLVVFGLFVYIVCGGCPRTWTGFSGEAFCGLWEFLKLSVSSGVMLCLQQVHDNTELTEQAIESQDRTHEPDSLSFPTLESHPDQEHTAYLRCNTTSRLAFVWRPNVGFKFDFYSNYGVYRVRVANELGAGNGKGAKFAAIVSVSESIVIGLFFWLIIMLFNNELALLFTSSKPVLQEFNNLSLLLAFTIVLNSVQPILPGVAVGSGWQAYVAYINLACYYLLGLPLGALMGLVFIKEFGYVKKSIHIFGLCRLRVFKCLSVEEDE